MESVLTTERLDELFASLPLHRGEWVWLVGGCSGLQVKFLLDQYPGIKIAVYEPQPQYVEILREKYEGTTVRVHPYALGADEGMFEVGLQDAECTFHWQHLKDAGLITQSTMKLPMEDVIEEWFWCENDERPKMLMMNCEGSELEIIQRLGICLKDIPCILTQFHSRTLGYEGCQQAYDSLTQTHEVKWRYNDWAWVYAEVKED